MLDNSLKEVESHMLNSSQCLKGFVDNGSMYLIINDQEIVWSFILIDGEFENTMIYPPGAIFDFNTEDSISEP